MIKNEYWKSVSEDPEDIESFPLDFDPVLCFTENGDLMVLQLLKYGSDPLSWEWETVGLKRNQAFSIEFVKKWIKIEEPI